MKRLWLKEALFAGQTGNAFKLGTVLTLGWFWPRLDGCSVLYRGRSMGAIDFANILTVAAVDAGQISPPSYVQHNVSSTYFYVIQRINSCGYQERTLAAAVKVSINADGELVKPRPNNIFGARLRQVAGNKIQLVWYYCPVEQQSAPVCFKIYYDGGTGQIDYGNAIATIGYKGRRFYSFQSDSLAACRYLFCIRVEDADGVENGSWAQLRIEVQSKSPDAISILDVETI